MMEEEEKLRIPMAQGLPWTTDQPEVNKAFVVYSFSNMSELSLRFDVKNKMCYM